MGRALASFTSGFSLAIFLVSLGVYIYATPYLGSMGSAYEMNETVYGATHASWFGGGLDLLDVVDTGGSLIPIIGQYAGYAGDLKELLIDVKALSETIKGTLGILIAVTSMALVSMIASFIIFIISMMFAIKPESKIIVQTASQTKYCANCGTQNQTGTKHCSECGKKM